MAPPATDTSFLPHAGPAGVDEALVQLAERAVHRIFSAGLKLAEVQGAVGSPRLRARVAAAVSDLDQAIQTAALHAQES